ncbi:MAG: lysine--tRNA ligase [Omnitrophica WOR_2 bacterium RIFCSPHIGHO2_02_FULL_68_15]|nr:MAG: lysine--tRNA ligase [Omnitrophica WOR_2 bacterium RIFCSPHIGHO2_02_FULL_68_15]
MQSLDDLVKQRLSNLDRLKAAGRDPYRQRFQPTAAIAELVATFTPGVSAKVAGRLMGYREHGKSIFADLHDQTGRLQLFFAKDALSDSFDLLSALDLGDVIGVAGELFATRTGEKTIKIHDWTILAKCLRPPPEKWHGLKDVESRYRQRYVDLFVNPSVRQVFETRSKLVAGIRRFLDARGFLEVETPMMQPVPGGAAARPFKTHHHALGMDLYLRIAPELYLKELLVGGLEKVYELNRNFRNEGLSPRHNPEFTMLEVYQAYSDYAGMRVLTEELITTLAQALVPQGRPSVVGGEPIPHGQGTVSLARPWRQVTFFDLLREQTKADCRDEAQARAQAARVGLPSGPAVPLAAVWDKLFEKVAQPSLLDPTFVLDYPTALCPLSKTKPEDPTLAERFELYVGGLELANAYSELNDPAEQARRFADQVAQRPAGAEQEFFADDEFVKALEYGMPPAGGLGIGIDRLVMLLTNTATIRDVILFPTLKLASGAAEP